MSFLYPFLRFVGHQHWIPGGRDRFIRLFAHPAEMPDRPFEVDFFGARYRGNLNNFIDWTVYFYGALAHNELFLLRDIAAHLRSRGKEAVGYDIGANLGHHTLYMSLYFDRVCAFEPFADVRRRIDEKIALNGRTNVTVLPVALGDEDGSFLYYPPEDENPGTGTMAPLDGRDAASAITVETRRADAMIASGELPVPNVVKIDVEGYEPRVLRGFRETLVRERPFVLMELLADTRSRLGGEEALRALLYDDAEIYEVANPRGKFDYALEPFRYDRAFEILVAPQGAIAEMPALARRIRN
jgi:FkbM family methyltransferase